MEAGIPSSADYLCTSSRDSFHCNGAKSREASGAKPTEKCFYLARLSSLLKVRFFWESYGPKPANRRCDSWKRDCGLLTATSPAFSYISYLRFSRSHAERLRRPSGLTARDSYEGGLRRREGQWGRAGKWEKLRQLPADFGIWSMDYVPPRMLIPLPFIERRFPKWRNG